MSEKNEENIRKRDDISMREEAFVSTGEVIQINAVSIRLSVGDNGGRNTMKNIRKRKEIEEGEDWIDMVEKELTEK